MTRPDNEELAKRVSQGSGPGVRKRARRAVSGAGFSGEQARRLLLAATAFELSVITAVEEAGLDLDLLRNAGVPVLVRLVMYGEARPKDLGLRVGLGSANMARTLDRLEEAGYIERVYGRVAGDRRGVTVSVTAEGRRVVEDVSRELAVLLGNPRDLEAYLVGIIRDPEGPPPDAAAGSAAS